RGAVGMPSVIGIAVGRVTVVGAVGHCRLDGLEIDPTAAVIGTVDRRRGGRVVCRIPAVGASRSDADGRIASAMGVASSAGSVAGPLGGSEVLGGHRDLLIARFRSQTGLALVLLDEVDELGPAGTSAGDDRSGDVLAVLDVDVRIHRHAQQVVGRVALDHGSGAADTPVVGQTDLV